MIALRLLDESRLKGDSNLTESFKVLFLKKRLFIASTLVQTLSLIATRYLHSPTALKGSSVLRKLYTVYNT